MQMTYRFPSRRLAALALLASFALPALGLHADTVYVRTTTAGKPLAYEKVKVQGIKKDDGGQDALFFTSGESGRETSKPLEQVAQVALDDEPAFTAAEAAYESGDLKAAEDGYRKAAEASSKDWVKNRSIFRLVEAANKTGDFSGAVTGFVALSAREAGLASKYKPAIPADKPDVLDPAIAQVKRAADGGKSDQKQVLLPFLVELYTARKDNKSAAAVLDELGKLNPGAAETPDAIRARGEVKLAEARSALAAKNYPAAQQTLESSVALFTEPAPQAEALYLLAQAKAAQASDPVAIKDAALAFMRVVANFKTAPGAPHVADSLLQTGALLEKLEQPKEALLIYKQVALEFKDLPAAQAAQQAQDRIAKAAKSRE